MKAEIVSINQRLHQLLIEVYSRIELDQYENEIIDPTPVIENRVRSSEFETGESLSTFNRPVDKIDIFCFMK